METDRFDSLSRQFARRVSRRTALKGSATGLAAAALGVTAMRASAQDATPAATPAAGTKTVHPEARAAEKPEFLFTQTFDAGTWAPKAGAKDTYTLTLSGASAETAYFSDRPERIVGLSATDKFLKGLGFTPSNPPNAALVAAPTGGGDQDVLVIELFNATFDAKAKTLTYDAKILKDYEGTGIASLALQQTDFDFNASFGHGGLFIDDCADGGGTCYQPNCPANNQNCRGDVGPIQFGCCYDWHKANCEPCNSDFSSQYYGSLCANDWGGCVSDDKQPPWPCTVINESCSGV